MVRDLFLHRGPRRRTVCRALEHAGHVPAAFGPDDHIGVGADADRIGMLVELGDYFDVIEVRKDQLVTAVELLESEAAPKIDQTLLGVAIEPAVALLPAKLDSGAHQLEREARVAEFPAHRKALDLGKIGEETDAQAARRLIADIAKQMGRRQIVAVELFLVGTFLLADIDRASQTGDAHEILEGARDGDRDGARTRTFPVRIVERSPRRARKRIEVRSVDRPDLGALRQPERLIKAETVRCIGSRIEIDAG